MFVCTLVGYCWKANFAEKTIKETFDLSEVPRPAFVLGLAGVLPYVATSGATLFCAYDINHANIYGHGYLMSHDTAVNLLHVLEPLQIGYGAVVSNALPLPPE
jgi:hypothetical protein